jgi:hypothetical protein
MTINGVITTLYKRVLVYHNPIQTLTIGYNNPNNSQIYLKWVLGVGANNCSLKIIETKRFKRKLETVVCHPLLVAKRV